MDSVNLSELLLQSCPSGTSLPTPNKKGALDEDAFLSTRSGSLLDPFFANVDELLALCYSLKDEGLLDQLTAIPAITERSTSSPIPYRP